MNTKQIGNIAEIAFMYECSIRKTTFSIPYGDNCRYDFVVDINNKLLKIQVKHMKDCGDYYRFSCKSNNWNSGKTKNYKNDVDYLFAYCKDTKNWVLIPIEKCNNNQMLIRKIKSKNNQVKNVNFIENYNSWFD